MSPTENLMAVVRVIAKGAFPEAPGEFHWLVESEGGPLVAFDADGNPHYTMGCNVTDGELQPLPSLAANDARMVGTALICLA